MTLKLKKWGNSKINTLTIICAYVNVKKIGCMRKITNKITKWRKM